MVDYRELTPSAASLMQSLRDIGYSMQMAIADIIDNSITATANQIDIRFSWSAGKPWIAIIDTGYGMTFDELVNAMRFGSMNPLTTRSRDDLGRFGLGMKTASFSQCRHLTVLSKKEYQTACCEWDLDKISENHHSDWRLGILGQNEVQQRKVLYRLYQSYLAEEDSGTIILWENIDRLDEQDTPQKREKQFNALIDDTRNHLELVFHRFLSPPPGIKKTVISMNGDDLEPFDPFNTKNLATQELEQQKISINGETIVVQPYVLPHHSKVSRQEYEAFAGDSGYLHNQGFYVYRNRRLIIKGTWFRLVKKEELNKLIRVRVDIPNTLDHLWKIDVKKSHASPPEIIRNELRRVIEKIEDKGRKVYRQRGTVLSSNKINPVWQRRAAKGMITYQINRDHPLVIELAGNLPEKQRVFFEQILKMFECSFPVDTFFHDFANKPERMEKPALDENTLEQLLDVFLQSWQMLDISDAELFEKILSVEPFASNKSATEELLKRKASLHE